MIILYSIKNLIFLVLWRNGTPPPPRTKFWLRHWLNNIYHHVWVSNTVCFFFDIIQCSRSQCNCLLRFWFWGVFQQELERLYIYLLRVYLIATYTGKSWTIFTFIIIINTSFSSVPSAFRASLIYLIFRIENEHAVFQV